MIRFILKSALGLGVLAMVLPFGDASRSDTSGIDFLALLSGAQEAVSDVGGFCGRAPIACEAGREVAIFAGERIEAGMRIGYGYINGKLSSPVEVVAQDREAQPDPLVTGAVTDADFPRPYTPPKTTSVSASVPAFAAHETPKRNVAIPTPAPRT